MKIATWNVNSLKVRLPQVLFWLESSKCDILALQELKMDNENFPEDIFTSLGYYCVFNGQKTYNGVAIISKAPITDVIYDIPDFSDPQKRVISAKIDGIQIICAYFVNGESVDSQKYLYKLDWCQALHNYVAYSVQLNENVILLGDFNIAPHDIDVYDPKLWEGKVLCSDKERAVWFGLLDIGLHDSFRLFNNDDKQYSWWDYRNFAFRRKLGMRIDHILVSESLKSASRNCIIDIEPRKNERPSDHTPVVLEL